MRIDVLNYFSNLKTAIATYLHALFKSLSFMSLNEIYFLGGLARSGDETSSYGG